MQGALYFPFIAVPNSAWWTRTMLYWDFVATIVPNSYIEDPDLLDPHTLELVRRDLLIQVLPDDAGSALRTNFGRYLRRLTPDELEARRSSLRVGGVSRVHVDKWLSYASGRQQLLTLGLAERSSRRDSWMRIESRTAAEFMSALAVSLCQAAHGPHIQRGGREVSWIPTTDREDVFSSLMAGFVPADRWHRDDVVVRRTRGEARVVELRSQLLERILPVPAEGVPIDKIVAFRQRHGDLLPDLRRYIEAQMDGIVQLEDEDLQFRAMDRIVEEVEDRVVEAEAYIKERLARRVSRSSIVKLCSYLPVVGTYVGGVREFAGSAQSTAELTARPLAYLAFASAAFRPVESFARDPRTGMPLIDAMSA